LTKISIFGLGSETEKLKDMQISVKKAFESIRDELNVHLDTINQNTSEVQSIYDYLGELDSKIEKLSERIDEMQMFINPSYDTKFDVELTHREQEVFLVLYAETNRTTAKEIARKLGFTDEMVNRYVYNLISKGIPILKHFVDNQLFLHLDLKFKDLQARKNILKIDESISKQLLSDKAF